MRVVASIVLLAVSSCAIAQVGPWEPSFPPSPSESGHNFLLGVSAASAADAWAVGYFNVTEWNDTDTYTLAAHWDGTAWTRVPTPSPSLGDGRTDCALYDVAVVSSDDAWAAGYKTMQHPGDGVVGTQLLVLRWDGSSWSEVEAPITPVGGTGAFVRDILVLAEDDVWFVGLFNFVNAGGPSGLAMHWDGSGFTLHETPNITQNSEKNLSISRAADGDLWIAGMNGRGGWGQIPYVARGDGDHWDVVAQWSQYEYTDLQSIVAFADDDVWIGAAKVVGFNFAGYVWLHYDGSSWTEVPVPDQYHEPHLAAAGPDDIYSGGSDSLFHWDGSAWSLVGRFEGVDDPNMNMMCIASDGSVFGAGRYFPGNDGRTLAARFVPDAGCAADMDGNGTLDAFDFLAFQSAFGGGDPAGDFDGNGTLNVFDFLAFQAAFGTGC